MSKIFKRERTDIPALNTASGVAITDGQKANLIAKTLKDNFTENNKPSNFNTTIDSDVTNTLENFFSLLPSTPIASTNPDEIAAYVLPSSVLCFCNVALEPKQWPLPASKHNNVTDANTSNRIAARDCPKGWQRPSHALENQNIRRMDSPEFPSELNPIERA
ncbi:hypothetical protein TNCV_5066011 [Trichonephila clavipes]|nr:hypothetical protein TNCV_5066011 [Trichonephila clavipes]